MKRILPRLDALARRVAAAAAAGITPVIRWRVHVPEGDGAEADRLTAKYQDDPHVTVVRGPYSPETDPDR